MGLTRGEDGLEEAGRIDDACLAQHLRVVVLVDRQNFAHHLAHLADVRQAHPCEDNSAHSSSTTGTHKVKSSSVADAKHSHYDSASISVRSST